MGIYLGQTPDLRHCCFLEPAGWLLLVHPALSRVSVKMEKAEYKQWIHYLRVLTDSRTSPTIRRTIIKSAHRKCILAIEEILLNLQAGNIPADERLIKLIKRNKKKLGLLANPKTPIEWKRRALKNKPEIVTKILPIVLDSLSLVSGQTPVDQKSEIESSK